MAPKPPPRAPKTSPSLDFHRFWVDFGRFFDDFLYHVGYFLSGLPHYFFGYLELSFSNFWPQVQMCWGRPQGSVRSQKCDVAHLLSSLPFCFCYLEPYFSSFGVVSGVISELRSTARWREGRRQVDIRRPLKASSVSDVSQFNLLSIIHYTSFSFPPSTTSQTIRHPTSI